MICDTAVQYSILCIWVGLDWGKSTSRHVDFPEIIDTRDRRRQHFENVPSVPSVWDFVCFVL